MGIWYSIFTESSSCPSYMGGLYTAEQIDGLVFGQGYIPVSSRAEIQNIKNSVSVTMGLGTCWEGTYTCGLDKKYVQVDEIDCGGNGVDTITDSRNGGFTGIYDGNELAIISPVFLSNPTGGNTCGMFVTKSSIAVTKVLNVRLVDVELTQTAAHGNAGAVLARHNNVAGASFCEVTNCKVINSFIRSGTASSEAIGAFGGNIGGGLLMTNCHCENVIIDTKFRNQWGGVFIGNGVTGLAGMNERLEVNGCSTDALCIRRVGANSGQDDSAGSGLFIGKTSPGNGWKWFKNCHSGGTFDFRGDSSAYDRRMGGFIGSAGYGTLFEDCRVNASYIQVATTWGARVGGFAGATVGLTVVSPADPFQRLVFRRCAAFLNGAISRYGTGGFSGDNYDVSVYEDCYASGSANSTGAQAAGFSSSVRNVNTTWTNCLSVGQVIGGGTSDNGFSGNVGIANNCYYDVTINPATGSARGTGQTTVALQTPTSNTGIYSAWTIPPWDFGTSSDYPVLSTLPTSP